MYLPLMLVIVLVYTVNARNCLSPKVMNNFDMDLFQGEWFEMAFKTSNLTDENVCKSISCVLLRFKLKGDHYDTKLDYISNGQSVKLIGKSTPYNTTTSLFNMNFPRKPEYNKYVFKVLCTDYDNYAVTYSSQQFKDGQCSEFEIFMVRHRLRYLDILTSDKVENCFLEKLQTSIEELIPIPHCLHY